jgi:hypothetical protein
MEMAHFFDKLARLGNGPGKGIAGSGKLSLTGKGYSR